MNITVLDAANSYPCAPTIGGRCDLLHISDIGAWAFADGDRNRIYHFADSGVMVHIEALNGTVLDVLLEGAPLLDALTITPVG